jgi:novobiocin biosynthesis protein NovU/D-mycarose 3-C-methyltransferase
MVQLDVAIDSEELFGHYVYETPVASSLTAHYNALIEQIFAVYSRIRGAKAVPAQCFEMGSNNGEFLAALRDRVNIPLLGIEPAKNIAEIARARGFETACEFFSMATVREFRAIHGTTDLFVARHCMAHLDDLRGTLCAIAEILTPNGIAVIENAYVMSTLRGAQFDQLYHEHMSYFAFRPMKQLLEACGLHVHHVDTSTVHGGSLLLFVSKKPYEEEPESVTQMLVHEESLPRDLDTFAFSAQTCIAGLQRGVSAASGLMDSYGATAKGNTLLNVIGDAWRHIRFAVDSTPSKQGLYLPGTGIPVISEEAAERNRPDVYLLTAWNYEAEIVAKNRAFIDKGGRFLVPLPFPRMVAR